MPAPKKSGGEMSKKAAGQARKADAANAKKANADKQAADAEAQEWSKGSKSNAKAEAAAAKAAEAARKKAEKDALLKEEEASMPSKPKGAGAKAAVKKSRGIDSALGGFDNPSQAALNASGIDNALDALDLTGNAPEKLDRHPERRFKAAYAAYEERRLEEMKDDKTLRKNQKINIIRDEFRKHPDNPFNQVHATYDASKDELKEIKEAERLKKEKRLASGLSA